MHKLFPRKKQVHLPGQRVRLRKVNLISATTRNLLVVSCFNLRLIYYRCHRLKKDCQTSVSIRQRNFKKFSTSRTTQLEGKLDSVVSSLGSQATLKQLQTEPPLTKHHDTPLNLDTHHLSGESASIPSINAILDSPTTLLRTAPSIPARTATYSIVSQLSSCIHDNVAVHEISDTTAEKQLDTFCHAFLPFFPFIHIPPLMRASDLRQQKPFLWLVIMSLTTTSVEQQRAMGNTIRRIISQNVVAEHEKNMDILLGLICYLAW
jgi:hypothetical protein